MHFTIYKSHLQQAVTNLINVIEKGSQSNPILQNIKFCVNDDNLTLSASNLDITKYFYIANTSYEKLKNGEALINAKMLQNILLKIPNDAMINLEKQTNQEIFIKINKTKFKINSINVEEFPEDEDFNTQCNINFSINYDVLCNFLKCTLHAVSKDQKRHQLNGVYLSSVTKDNQKEFVAVATDEHRLMKLSIPHDQNIEDFGVIIPEKTIPEIIKTTNLKQMINVGISKHYCIKITTDESRMTSKLVDGDFPPYERVIPQHFMFILRIKLQPFYEVLQRCLILSDEQHKTCHITFKENLIVIESKKSSNGNFYEEFETTCPYDNIPTLAFNGKYFLESLSNLNTDEFYLSINSKVTPVLLSGVESANNQDNVINRQAIILPLRD
jgi:DNA polymerase-3 subunit beta